jgi:hypothetical protein
MMSKRAEVAAEHVAPGGQARPTAEVRAKAERLAQERRDAAEGR